MNGYDRTKVGIIGCGNIAERYVVGMRRFPRLEIAGCADLDGSVARVLAERTQIHAFPSVEALLADASIDLVVNITPPQAHAGVTRAILTAGKHVYVEKPITTDPNDARELLREADSRGLLLGAAPDTFLGSASQTARNAIDSGIIGRPIAAVACIRYSRAEEWHPDPAFLFRPGGGPSLDLGPYYVSALVNLFGAVDEVSAFSRIGTRVRAVTSPRRRVETVEVSIPTHASASLRFHNGAIATLISSFDIWNTDMPFVEIYGESGTLQLGDPNEYDSPVRIRRHADSEWTEIAPVLTPTGEPATAVQLLRGAGVADLAAAIVGHSFRASGALAAHVLDVVIAIDRSSDLSSAVKITSSIDRPSPTVEAQVAAPVPN